MATEKLANWASTLEFSSLPQSVVDAAIRSFQNSLGCIIGGSTHPTVHRAIEGLRPTFGHAQCTILGQSGSNLLSADASNAALINGIASHVHDYDDTHLHTVIHPAGAVVVALLAYTQLLHHHQHKAVSGREFITALVAGIEVGLRVGNAISPNHYTAGWHITGTVSPIAVAAALSNLLRLPPQQAVHALGIAATQPVGIRVHFGTDAKALHAGRAAQNGMLAAQLAGGGFTAAEDALEGRRGWVEVLGHGADAMDEQVGQLLALSGSQKANNSSERTTEHDLWEIEKNTFKPFPCGIVIHPIIDACIQLHNENPRLSSTAKDKTAQNVIESVHLTVHPLVLDLTGKKTPRDGLEAKFSVYHGAAIGLARGAATPAEYTDDVVADADVVAVRGRVVAEVDKNMRSDEAVVTVQLSADTEQGENEQPVKLQKHVEHAVGSLARPMTNEQLQAKFLAQVSPVLGDKRAQEVDELAWNVLQVDDVVKIAEAAG